MISDTHIKVEGGPDALRLEGLVDRINSGAIPDVDLLLISGDVVDLLYGSYPGTSDDRLARAMRILGRLEIEFYPGIGNHDYKLGPDHKATTPEQLDQVAEIWRKQTGRETVYSFEHEGFRFVALDNYKGRFINDPGNGEKEHFDAEQLDWLEKLLSEEMPTILYFHYPIETDHDLFWTEKKAMVEKDEVRVHAMIKRHKDQIKAIFVGHGHLWVKDTLYSTIPVYETAGFGRELAKEDNYHLLDCDPADGSIQVTKGDERAYYIEPVAP